MTESCMSLAEFAANGADGDLLREIIPSAARRPIETAPGPPNLGAVCPTRMTDGHDRLHPYRRGGRDTHASTQPVRLLQRLDPIAMEWTLLGTPCETYNRLKWHLLSADRAQRTRNRPATVSTAATFGPAPRRSALRPHPSRSANSSFSERGMCPCRSYLAERDEHESRTRAVLGCNRRGCDGGCQ